MRQINTVSQALRTALDTLAGAHGRGPSELKKRDCEFIGPGTYYLSTIAAVDFEEDSVLRLWLRCGGRIEWHRGTKEGSWCGPSLSAAAFVGRTGKFTIIE
jgi:hypothetical protein